MTALRLWLAIEAVPYQETVAFYRDAIGPPVVDGCSDGNWRVRDPSGAEIYLWSQK